MADFSELFLCRLREVLALDAGSGVDVRKKAMGWGTGVRSGRSVGGQVFRLHGETFRRGWGDHAQSRHTVKLPAPGKIFQVLVGVQDSPEARRNPAARMQFTVFVGGVAAARSRVLTYEDTPELLTVELGGAEEFDLAAVDTNFPPEYDGCPSCAHGNWVSPVITLCGGTVLEPGEGFRIDALLPSLEYAGEAADLCRWTRRVEKSAENADREAWKAEFTSPDGLLTVRTSIKLYKDFPVYEMLPEVVASGSSDTEAVEHFNSMSLRASVPLPEVRVRRISGVKNHPDDFAAETLTLKQRWGHNRVLLDTDCGTSSAAWLPFVGVDLDETRGMEVAVGWTGAWQMDIVNRNELSIDCGMMRTGFFLHPGEKLRQPSVLVFFREDQSVEEMKRDFRRFMLKHKSPRDGAGNLIPGSVSLGNPGHWGEKAMLDEIDWARENRFPATVFWMDAGWYGPARTADPRQPCGGWSHWFETAGDWSVNPLLYPSGDFRKISEAVHRAGMKFLLWFSPECAFRNTPVAQEHPEYFYPNHDAGDPRRLLNLGHDGAWRWAFDLLVSAIERNGIDCYRQDFNFTDMTMECWRLNDAPRRVGVSEARHVEGLYRLWDELKKRFPDLLIDNCASGGRRLDFETASRAHSYAVNDRTEDQDVPEEMQNTVALSIHYIPFQCSCAYRRTGVDGYSAYSYLDSAIQFNMARYLFGLEEFSPEQVAHLKRWAAHAVRCRDILENGDFYLLTPCSRGLDSWYAWQGDDPSADRGVVAAFRRPEAEASETVLKLRRMEENAMYMVEEYDGREARVSGRELASLAVKLPEKRSFRILFYRKLA